MHLVGKIETLEMLRLLLEALPGLFDSIGLLGKKLLDFADDLEGLFLDRLLVECYLVVFV